MKKNWLFALLCCCMCAFAVSCSDDDDDVVSGNDDQTENEGGSSSDAAPTVLVTTSAGSDTFTVNITVSSDAYQYGYVASTTSLSSVSAADIISNSVGGYSSGVYSASTDGTFKSVVVDASESTTYYVYAAAVSEGGTYSTVASGTVTTLASATSYNATMPYGLCDYFGNYYTESTTVEYYVILSDNELTDYVVGGTYYILDLISATELDSETATIPAGTYTLGESYAANELNAYYSLYGICSSYSSDDGVDFDPMYGFTSGSVTVSVSGSTTTITASLTDEYGNIHNISYSGEIEVYDATAAYSYSTLTGNTTVDLTGASCTAYYEGDALETGTAFWEFLLYSADQTECFQVSYCGATSYTAEVGLPTGSYTGEYTGKEGTYVTGIVYSGYLYYSWYYTLSSGSLGSTYSPFGSGTLTVTNNGDGTYTISIDVMDDADTYSIKASWTGTPSITDYSSYYTSTSVKSAGMESVKPAAARFEIPLVNPAFGKVDLR